MNFYTRFQPGMKFYGQGTNLKNVAYKGNADRT